MPASPFTTNAVTGSANTHHSTTATSSTKTKVSHSSSSTFPSTSHFTEATPGERSEITSESPTKSQPPVTSHGTSSTVISSSSESQSTSSTPHCSDKDCPGCTGICSFNTTVERCQCHCQEFVFGDTCIFGQNDTSPHIDTGAVPTQKTNFTLEIHVTFQSAFEDLNSPQSLEFIKTLERELEVLCKEADPQNFKNVQVIKLTPGSVVAESRAEYIYANNETQIQFVNTQLHGVLIDILNDTNNLNKISQAFNASVKFNGLTFPRPEINNITDLKPFVNCTQFANYTAEITNGQWQCVGPCKTNPNYCHQHGECLNNIYEGPTCRCFESSLEQFYGPQCDLSRYGPGFYGALFGSLAGALLILIIIVIAVIFKKRHMGVWKRRSSYNRRLSVFDEDFFDFSDTGDDNLGLPGTYSSESFRPRLQNINTQSQLNLQRL